MKNLDPRVLLQLLWGYLHVYDHYFSEIFSSETALLIKDKLYVERPWVGETNVCSRYLGNMTKIASNSIYGKNPSKIPVSRTSEPISRTLGM